MRVGIDLTALLPQATGVDVSLLGLVRHLAAIDRDTRYTLFANREDRSRLAALSLPRSFAVAPWCLRPRAARLAFQQVLLPAAAIALRLDVVHSPSFIAPVVRAGARHLLTVHDLTFDSLPHVHIPLRRSRAFRGAVAHSVRSVDLVTVPSRSVAGAIRERCPDVPAARVRVVPWGVGEEFRPRDAAEAAPVLRRLAIPADYVLFVGTIEPRKNLPALLAAYRAFASGRASPPHLVLAGRPGWGIDAVRTLAAADGLRGRVHLVGYVPGGDLPLLYAGARLLAYPSLDEGFGFPPLEAMASGVPVVASRAPALAENLEGAAELVAASDVAALADAIARVADDPALRRARVAAGLERARGFAWRRTAHAYLDCYRELAQRQLTRSGLRPGPAT